MSATVRSHLIAGIALASAAVVTVQTPPPVEQNSPRMVEAAVSLAAAVGSGQACSGYNIDGCDIWAPQTYTPITVDKTGSVFNIPANVLNAIISIPRAYLDGLNDLSYGFEVTGSWWVYTPTNVLGFDPADPPKVAALMNLAIPFKALSQPLGEGLTWWAKANLPMSESCTGTAGPVCPDPEGLLKLMFREPISFLTNGWKFPRIFDPVSPLEGSMGNPLPADYPGNIDREVPWSRAYIQLNPFDAQYSVINYLTADPKTNRPAPITIAEVTTAVKRFVKAFHQDFYPFVPMSFLLKGWPYTALTPLFKPFLPVLCPDCNPLNPAWPPGATEQPWPSSAVPPPAPAEATAGAPVAVDAAPTSGAPAQPSVAQAPAAERVSLTGRAKRDKVRVPKPAAATTVATAETPAEAPAESGITQRRAARTAEAGSARADRAGHSARARAAATSGE
jgi:hypothetical protein